MGQKINPNIFRLGTSKKWKTEFFEKKNKELPLYIFKDLEIKDYVERFFENNGILINDFRQHFNDSTVTLYISYFLTSHCVSKLNFSPKLTKLLIKNKNATKLITKLKSNNNNNKIFSNNIFLASKHNKKPSFLQLSKSNLMSIDIKNYLTSKNYYKLRNIHNKKKKLIKNVGIFDKFIKTLNLFTVNQHNIICNFSCLNYTLKFTAKDKNIKKLLFSLRRFKNTNFLKNGIELLLHVVINKNSSNLLSKFIAFYVKTEKRHKFLLSFLKKTLIILMNSRISNIKGVKIKIKGRLNGAPKAKRKSVTVGHLPIQTINTCLDYSHVAVHNKNGTYGIKVWIAGKINNHVFTA